MVYSPYICTLPPTVCPLSGCRNSCLGVPPGFLNPDPISDQSFIFHTRFQTWSQESMPDFRPTYMCAPCFKFVLHKQILFNYHLD